MAENAIIKALSENSMITVLARAIMIASVPVSGAFLYFSRDWLDSHVTNPIADAQSHIEQLVTSNMARDKIIERHDFLLTANGENIAAERSDVKELGAKVDNLATSLNGLVEVLKDRDRRNNSGNQ